jgi:hypothetical protein
MKIKFSFKHTDATIIGEKREVEAAKRAIIYHYRELERFIRRDPFFLLTLEPYEIAGDAPLIVRKMIHASSLAGVGPMASVAGAIAELALDEMIKEGATHAVVENGGDIALINDSSLLIGINSSIHGLAFRIEPGRKLGICTSSGKIGHSISFGDADASVVIAESATLADAVATALCNRVREEGLKTSFSFLSSIPGVEGALVIFGNNIGKWGNLPKLVKTVARSRENLYSNENFI